MRVRAYHGTDSTDFEVWDSLRTQMFLLPLSVAPDSVVLDPDGWILKQIVSPPASVEDDQRPVTLRLLQNYPNPFNPTTSISFQIPVAGLVSLKVFDVLGREVATLVNVVKPAGEYVVPFDASNLSSGIYVYRLTANHTQLFRKMLLLR